MENSDKANSSSTTSEPSVSSKSDENGQNYPPSAANLNLRKLVETEKMVKKKVLTERNETVDSKSIENSLSEIPNVDPNPKSSSCQVDSVFQTALPYDPLTNYLSPRPRFLRYKPSRRREIFLRTVGEDSLLISHTSSSEEEETELQDKETREEESEGKFDEIDDEGEGDEKEDRGWTVKELLKSLLVIASLILSTLYVTSMNTTTPSFEVSGAFRSGFCPILNHTGEFGSRSVVESRFENGSNFWDEEVTEAASMRNSKGASQLNHQEDAKNRGFMEQTQILYGENEGGKAVHGNFVKVEYSEQAEEATEKPPGGGSITEEMAEGEENGVKSSELIFEDDDDREKEIESNIFNAIAGPSEILEEDEITEASIINGFDDDKLLSGILTADETEYTPQIQVVEKEEGGDWEMIESNTAHSESSVLEADKITILEGITNIISSFVEDLEKLKSELIELMHTETESVLKAVLGLSVSSAMLTWLVLSIKFKKMNDDKKEPAISVNIEPLLQSPVAKAEKVITRESPSIKPTCDVNISKNEPIRNVDSIKMLSSSIHLRDEVESFKEIYHHEAPTVQFLDEFVVGEISSSLENKTRSKNWTIEVEDSNFPVSIDEKPVSKNMNSVPEQALSEFSSTTYSQSYGSLTTKKKIVKKEVGGGGEVKSIPTPVRRSTRIRNRIVSP